MESTTTTAQGVDLTAKRSYPGIALVLALLSLPGSLFTWDSLPGGGFVWGAPLAIAAIALGVQARSGPGRGKAIAAIAIGGAMVAMMLVWTIVESV